MLGLILTTTLRECLAD